MQLTSRILATSAFALCVPLNAYGAHWYVGGSAGQATTTVDDNTINTRLSNAGLTGTAHLSGTSRAGWRLFGGYAVNPYLDLEAGYTHLGNIGMTMSVIAAPSETQLKAIRPGSGNGFEFSMLGKYPFTERLSGFARIGLFHWEQKYDVGGATGGSVRFNGDDALMGLGAEWRFSERWSTRLSWDRYTVAKDKTTLIALGLTYRFAATTDELAARETPQPQTVAPPAPVVAEPAPVVAAPVQEEPVVQPLPKEEPRAVAKAPEPERWLLQFTFKRTKLIGQESALDAMAAHLATHPGARVQITGHTDASGAENFNPYLSRLRAKAVVDALVARGVERSRIAFEGRGAAEPLADNRTRAGRAQNRRAEIVIYPEEQAR